LDLLRGECAPAEAEALTARLAADPALRAERDRLAAFLSSARAAHDVPLSAADAARVAARIRHRAQREDARPLPAAPAGRFQWPRFLAIAVGAHVVVLGLLAVFSADEPRRKPDDGTLVLRTQDGPWSSPGAMEGDAAFPDPEPDLADAMPIEELLRDLGGAPPDERVLALDVPASDAAASAAMPAFARAGLVRTDPEAKYAILARVGERNDLAQVEDSLRSLARAQAEDGSFAPTPSAGASVRTTATVLLAFLGDGNTSRAGTHRDVVAKGVAWLRKRASAAGSVEDRAIALAALTEDYAFARGEMTPAEARARAEELRDLVSRIAAESRGSTAASPWVALALDAGARAGVADEAKAGGRTWAATYAAMPHAAEAEPRTAVLEGTALLLARKAEVFRAWNRRASAELKARLRSGTADVEEVALIVLALEVPYRTY
jgi:hypothetical protein